VATGRQESPLRDRPVAELLEGLVERLLFPLVMGGGVVWAAASMQSGAVPFAAILPPMILAYVAVAAFERICPFRSVWNRSVGDIHVDASFAVLDLGVERFVQFAIAPAAAAAGAWTSAALAVNLWPHAWPLAGQLILALVVAELPKYWGHRFMHEWDFLWRFHAVHHSVPRLYWLNASRFHPVDLGIDTALGVATISFVGCNAEVIALFILVTVIHGIFQHCNIKLRLGPLNWFFSMAELHRWHHSRELAEANNNYGNNLIVWDVVFGTRFLPDDREPPEDVGLSELEAFPMTFGAQLAAPARWSEIKERSAAER
jgi:sterol desaturase/sphingolipid hydroxylase (fatty acid hydroxylase superfamily)